ncbi:MAG: hypothetical protein ABFS28_02000 [Bacteroidota bacterium]
MNRIIRFSLTAAAMLIFALQLSAQGPGGGRGFQLTEEDIRERAENTAKTLKLNDDQHKKILAVEMDFYNKMQIERQKMMNAGGPPADREEMRAKMMKIRDERNAEYEKVLSPDQYKQFIEMQEQRRNEMRQQRQQNSPDGQPEERPARGRGRG